MTDADADADADAGEWINMCTLETTTNPDVDGSDGWAKLMGVTQLTRYYASPNKTLFLGEAFSGKQSEGYDMLISFTNQTVASGIMMIIPSHHSQFDIEMWHMDGTRGRELPVPSLTDLFDDWSRKITEARKDPRYCDELGWQVTDLGVNDVTLKWTGVCTDTQYTVTLHDLQKFFEQCDDVMSLMERHPL